MGKAADTTLTDSVSFFPGGKGKEKKRRRRRTRTQPEKENKNNPTHRGKGNVPPPPPNNTTQQEGKRREEGKRSRLPITPTPTTFLLCFNNILACLPLSFFLSFLFFSLFGFVLPHFSCGAATAVQRRRRRRTHPFLLSFSSSSSTHLHPFLLLPVVALIHRVLVQSQEAQRTVPMC